MRQHPNATGNQEQHEHIAAPVLKRRRFAVCREPIHLGDVDVAKQDERNDDRPECDVKTGERPSLYNESG